MEIKNNLKLGVDIQFALGQSDWTVKRKSKRGGARPGAGRKPLGVVALHCYPKAETVQRIRSEAHATGRSIGQVIDDKL